MPLREPTRWWSLTLAVAGGLLTEAAFPDLGWWGCAFLGVAALFVALGRDSARWNALVGLLWGLAFFAPQIVWADYAVGRVPWLALTVFESCYIAVLGAAWSWVRRGAVIWRSAALQTAAFVILWVAVEDLRSSVPFGGFPWGRLAFSQSDSPLLALAWLGGAPLVSAAVCLVGVATDPMTGQPALGPDCSVRPAKLEYFLAGTEPAGACIAIPASSALRPDTVPSSPAAGDSITLDSLLGEPIAPVEN